MLSISYYSVRYKLSNFHGNSNMSLIQIHNNHRYKASIQNWTSHNKYYKIHCNQSNQFHRLCIFYLLHMNSISIFDNYFQNLYLSNVFNHNHFYILCNPKDLNQNMKNILNCIGSKSKKKINNFHQNS